MGITLKFSTFWIHCLQLYNNPLVWVAIILSQSFCQMPPHDHSTLIWLVVREFSKPGNGNEHLQNIVGLDVHVFLLIRQTDSNINKLWEDQRHQEGPAIICSVINGRLKYAHPIFIILYLDHFFLTINLTNETPWESSFPSCQWLLQLYNNFQNWIHKSILRVPCLN